MNEFWTWVVIGVVIALSAAAVGAILSIPIF